MFSNASTFSVFSRNKHNTPEIGEIDNSLRKLKMFVKRLAKGNEESTFNALVKEFQVHFSSIQNSLSAKYTDQETLKTRLKTMTKKYARSSVIQSSEVYNLCRILHGLALGSHKTKVIKPILDYLHHFKIKEPDNLVEHKTSVYNGTCTESWASSLTDSIKNIDIPAILPKILMELNEQTIKRLLKEETDQKLLSVRSMYIQFVRQLPTDSKEIPLETDAIKEKFLAAISILGNDQLVTYARDHDSEIDTHVAYIHTVLYPSNSPVLTLEAFKKAHALT